MGDTITQRVVLLINLMSWYMITRGELELNCNYGVNYTKSSDFYATYILDTCYTLNTKSTDPPLSVSLQYACDFSTGEINEKVWMNQICVDTVNHTNPGHLQTKHCDLNKIHKPCNFLWLSSFRQYSHECKPHEHTILKFGMILDECILSDNDQSAFKNVYAQTENNRRQIIQFQYLNFDDCIHDNIHVNNIDVTQSIADDIYDFIHEECNSGRYYTVQPPEIVYQTTSSPNTTTLTSAFVESTNITNNTNINSANASICNYMIRYDTSLGFYLTILEHKCYSQQTGSKQYECQNEEFMVREWVLDTLCDGPIDTPKKVQDKTYCIESNNGTCDTITVFQYHADENCTKDYVTDETFVKEYTFIVNMCLYVYINNGINQSIYIYNQYDDAFDPKRITQFHFDSYDKCINTQFDIQSIEENSMKIIAEQCIGEFYYEILFISKQTTPLTPSPVNSILYMPSKEKQNGFGETFITVELMVSVLCVSIILVVCCGVMCWYSKVKGYTCSSICWNLLCCANCARYNRISNVLMNINNEEDTGDDSVEIGDNMEFAALSEHR